MADRISHHRIAPEAGKALGGATSAYFRASAIDAKLRALVELRVSQINGCAFCVDKHSQEARAAGEAQQRLDCLPVWRETPLYTERERAALGWAEAVTLVQQTHVPDDVYQQATAQFSEKDLVDLTFIVAVMNAWNRIAISFRQGPKPRTDGAS